MSVGQMSGPVATHQTNPTRRADSGTVACPAVLHFQCKAPPLSFTGWALPASLRWLFLQ